MSHHPMITVAAAIILNEHHQTLLVRKKNTAMFMHVGGKLELNESPECALAREVSEEIGCEIEIISFIGEYITAAANEKNHSLKSYLYQVKLQSEPQQQAEIEEMKWVDIQANNLKIAPLTRDISIPWCKKYLGLE